MPPINRIYYQKGIDYSLTRRYQVETGIKIPSAITDGSLLHLSASGLLTQDIGWGWDGISGFPDLISGMRGSSGHDGLYRLFRLGLLSLSYRPQVDDVYHRHCIEDGMHKWIADSHLDILYLIGHHAASPENRKETFVAPVPPYIIEEEEETY